MDFVIPMLAAGLSEGSATLLKDFTVAMVIAAAGLALAKLVRQPPVLGYLLAGMLIGPFTLPTPLISNIDTIGLLAELGLILLLFGIGLELGWRRIRSIGFQVLVIGVIEISVLTLFGVWIAGILPGIDASHGLYLGGAIAISSSAILLKGLRDSGNLNARWGQTIVGILLVEDFAAVVLLTVLAGLATTGTASLADAGLLVAKLGVFCIVVLVMGTMVVSKVMQLFSHFQSDETLLLASLGFCFLLALCATLLGLSPAAGAFLIGVVIGDTEASWRVTRMIAPVRDMFGALFFLSIGMLIDYHTLGDYLVPALVVVGVFMFGKITANTVGSILAGRSPSDALKVGMTMPQMGEFSLAIGRLSPADAVGGAALGPILSISTAITSALAPLTSRAALPLAGIADRRTPPALRRVMLSIRLGVDIFWSAVSLAGETGEQFRTIGRRILINVCIIGVLSAAGTGALYIIPQVIGKPLPLPTGVAGLLMAGVIIGLSAPSAIRIWRSLGTFANLATKAPIARPASEGRFVRWRTLQNMVEYGLATAFMALLFLLSLPFVVRLFTLGSLSMPISLILLLSPALAVGIFSFRIHQILYPAFRDTFIDEAKDPSKHSGIVGHESEIGDIEPEAPHAHSQGADAPDQALNPLMSSTIGRMAEREELSRVLEDLEQEDESDKASPDSGTPGPREDSR